MPWWYIKPCPAEGRLKARCIKPAEWVSTGSIVFSGFDRLAGRAEASSQGRSWAAQAMAWVLR